MVLSAMAAMAILGMAPPVRVDDDPALFARLRLAAKSICSIQIPGKSTQPFKDGKAAIYVEPEWETELDVRIGELRACLDSSTGKITMISLSGFRDATRVWDPAAALDNGQILTVVQRVCQAADYGLPVEILVVSENKASCEFSMNVVPVYRGYRYTGLHSAAITIDYETGRLHTAYLWRYPSPPTDLRVKISPEDARAQMFGYVMDRKKVSILEEKHPMELVIWRPRGLGNAEDCFTDENHARMAEANQGLLVYRAMYNGPEHPRTNYAAFVDPVSGKLLNVDEMYPALGGASSANPPPAIAFAWTKLAGKVEVSVGGRSVTAKSASVANAEAPKAPGTGKPVILSCKGYAVRATYYATEGLLSLQVRNESWWGKPNKALVKVLGKALASGK